MVREKNMAKPVSGIVLPTISVASEVSSETSLALKKIKLDRLAEGEKCNQAALISEAIDLLIQKYG